MSFKLNIVEKRAVLLIVLPYHIPDQGNDTTRKKVRSFIAFPYGLLTVASYIKKYANKLIPEEEILQNIEEKLNTFLPDIVGYSMSYDISFPYLQKISDFTRLISARILQVAGGPAITTAYKEVLSETSLDAICYGEGEKALKELVDSPNMYTQINNPPWLTLKNMETTKPSTVYEDLDLVVDVDYSLINIGAYSMKEAFSPFTKYKEGSKQFFMVTSRGCPFKCVFCAEPSFHGANMRYVSVDNVVGHVRKLVDTYGLTVLTIYDDQILMNKERAKEIFRKLAPLGIRIEMPNGVTLSYIDQEMAYLMKSAGVDTIFLAIESGVKRVLNEIIKKPLSYNRIKPVISSLHANEIFVGSFFVLGLPGERPDERYFNREFILENSIDWAFFNLATPLRGSELFNQSVEKGWVDPKFKKLGSVDMTDYVITGAPGMNGERIKRDLLLMNLDVNFVNNRRMAIGDFETARLSFEEVLSRHSEQPFAHFYLAKSLEGLRITEFETKIAYHMSEYRRIVDTDILWKDVACYLGLETGSTSKNFFGYEALVSPL
jgi:anaerobic magnesium-protoporphyrin IX monomethyl ester cyclase